MESAGKRETHPPTLMPSGGTPEGMIDYKDELRSNTWKGQRDGNPEIVAQLARADAEADETQAQAEADDADFSPDVPESRKER